MILFVDGFSVSSTTELEKTRLETAKPIHFVSPLIRKEEINQINILANSMSFNSLEQFKRLRAFVEPHIQIFLRVNPEISIIKDDRYNPCRKYSKLGIPLDELNQYLSYCKEFSISGLHFHNACQEESINTIREVLDKIKNTLGDRFTQIQSINVGGGYLFSNRNLDELNKLEQKYKKSITIEPGFDLVNSSGYLVTSVTDMFERKGKTIAVLDTSINHLPEVFEYNCYPKVIGEIQKGQGYEYILAGASCLAGDVFKEYYFNKPIKNR